MVCAMCGQVKSTYHLQVRILSSPQTFKIMKDEKWWNGFLLGFFIGGIIGIIVLHLVQKGIL
jgi:hypothetical protein